jgi:hypothetical protein
MTAEQNCAAHCSDHYTSESDKDRTCRDQNQLPRRTQPVSSNHTATHPLQSRTLITAEPSHNSSATSTRVIRPGIACNSLIGRFVSVDIIHKLHSPPSQLVQSRSAAGGCFATQAVHCSCLQGMHNNLHM